MGISGTVPHISNREVYDVLGQVLIGGGEAGPQAGEAGWRTAAASQGGSVAYDEWAEAVRQHDYPGIRAATAS